MQDGMSHGVFVNVVLHVLCSYRGQLDYMLEGEFIWTPYSDVDIQRLPDYCFQGRDMWSVGVPLINFDIVEWHYTYRVKRQFGLQQEIPPLDTTYLYLHRIDRRGRGGQDWRQFHGSYVAAWTVRMDNLLYGTPADGHMQFGSEYMTWYRHITRSLLGNPSHCHIQGNLPTAATMEFWGETLGDIFHHSSEAMHGDDVDYMASFGLINELAFRALSLVSENHRMEDSSDVHVGASTSRTVRGRGRDRRHASSSMLHSDNGGASSQTEIPIDTTLPLFTDTEGMM